MNVLMIINDAPYGSEKAYNAFRLAGILQGIVGRVRDGTANSPHAAQQADRVVSLAQASWKFAEKAGAVA